MIKKYPRAAVINDLSGMGRCSLAVSIAVLSVMGVTPCALPTAVLSHQTAFENYYSHDLSREMELIASRWADMGERFDGIISGYVAHHAQVELIEKIIDDFGGGALVLVDPVLGDNGALYHSCSRETVTRMRSLAGKADVLTPNLTELCALTGADYDETAGDIARSGGVQPALELARKLRAETGAKIAVTGVSVGSTLCNISLDENGEGVTSNEKIGGCFSGTGDIFSSVLFGSLLMGGDLQGSVKRAGDFVTAAIKNTVGSGEDPRYGVRFEGVLRGDIRIKNNE